MEAPYFEQLASERRVVRYKRGMPVRRFDRKPGARAEALDALVYATAARVVLTIHADQRQRELASTEPPPPPAAPQRQVFRSSWMDR